MKLDSIFLKHEFTCTDKGKENSSETKNFDSTDFIRTKKLFTIIHTALKSMLSNGFIELFVNEITDQKVFAPKPFCGKVG